MDISEEREERNFMSFEFMSPYQNCLESWDLTRRLRRNRRQCSPGKGMGTSLAVCLTVRQNRGNIP